MPMEIRFPGGVAVEAVLAGFTIRTDQTVASGGGGTGPSPFDLFLAAVGTCTGFYALRFCQERSLSIEGLALTMDWERSPETNLVSKIRLELTLPGGFPDKYRTAILRAMDQCTVKRTILALPAIEVVTT